MDHRKQHRNPPNDRLRYQREKRGWSQNRVADTLFALCQKAGQQGVRKRGDINAQMVSKWELGQRPSPFWQEKLSELYGVSAEDLGFVKQPDALDASLNTSPPLSSMQTILSSSSLRPHDGLTSALPEVLPVDEQSERSGYSPQVAPLQRPGGGFRAGASSDILGGVPGVFIPHYQAVDIWFQKSDARPEQQVEAWQALLAGDLAALFDLRWSVEEMLDAQRIILEGVQVMPERIRKMISRRTVLDRFLKLTVATMIGNIPLPSSEKHVSFEDRAQLCRAFGENIAAGWKFFHSAGNAQVLAVGQAQLYLVQQCHALLPSRDRSRFYSSVYNLIGMALQHQGHSEEALEAHTNAHVAALGTGDPWYVTQSLICQANGHQALGQHAEAIETLEEALRTIGQTEEEHLRSRAHLLGCWADNALLIGEHTTAQKKLEASAVYLNHIGPNEEFDRANWHQLFGKYAFMTGDYSTAIEHFKKALVELPPHWIVRQVLILLPMMATYAHQHNREASFSTADKARFAIHALNAPSMNKTFAVSLCGLLEAFPNDAEVRDFVADRLHA